jgi:hypothetical protein
MAPKRSGQVFRLEPKGAKIIKAYPQMAQRFRDVGWLEFFTISKVTTNKSLWILHRTFMVTKWISGSC